MSKIEYITYAHEHQMGPMRVKQPLPARGLPHLNPFLLLHHAGPTAVNPESPMQRLSPHPHRGFEPVTFVFQGEVFHRDSMGNEGKLTAGDVQWMTAGRGVIHSEGPSPEFLSKGGVMEIIQLWINLPAARKMIVPRYQDIPSQRIPTLNYNGGEVLLDLVAGEYAGKTGPAETNSPLLVMKARMKAGATHEFEIPTGYIAAVYMLKGRIAVEEETQVEALNLVVLKPNTGLLEIRAEEDSLLLFLSAEPIHEPVVSYGPFVMNTKEEIQTAIIDYETGKMGDLDF